MGGTSEQRMEDLSVNMDQVGAAPREDLLVSIKRLHHDSRLCDVAIAVGDKTFPAHRVILACASSQLREFLSAQLSEPVPAMLGCDPHASVKQGSESGSTPQAEIPTQLTAQEVCTAPLPHEVSDSLAASGEEVVSDPPFTAVAEPERVTEAARGASAVVPSATRAQDRCPSVQMPGVSHPEAVQVMLDEVYGVLRHTGKNYPWPSTEEVNVDITHIGATYGLPALQERSARWFAEDLTTDDVVRRLAISDKYNLAELREGILDQLSMDCTALAAVVNAPDIVNYPTLLQELLIRVANLPATMPTTGRKTKRANYGA